MRSRWFARWRSTREVEKELQSHIEDLKQDYLREGMTQQEAERRARLDFGPFDLAKEECRDTLPLRWLDHLHRDFRFGLRMLAKNPSFTVVAVIAIALGIGADTAIYTIVRGALSWNMSLDHPNRIVVVTATDRAASPSWGVSYPDFRDLRAQTKSLAGLAAYQFSPVNLSDTTTLPEMYYCVQMSANGFSIVGQKPLLGRDFVAADEQPGAPAVVILGYHIWRDRYSSDPAVIGKTLRLDGVPHVVIGVMPPGRRFPEETDLWTPLVPNADSERRDNRNLMAFASLRDGVPIVQARGELAALAQGLAAQYPETNKDVTEDVRPIMEITGVYGARPVFLMLFVAVGFVLLIACADVANMLLARATERSREISIRVALGAGKLSIFRQLLAESVVLALTGGILGLPVALLGLQWFDRGLGTLVKPVWLQLSLDRKALFYLTAVSVGTGILFGLAPALRLMKTNINGALKDGGYGAVGSKSRMRLSNLLVAFQMALCVVLLAAAGLTIHSAVNLYNTPIGVNPAGLLTVRISLPESKYAKPETQVAALKDLQMRLASLPGVQLASAASHLPLSGSFQFQLEFEGRTNDSPNLPEAGGLVVANDYFQTMQVSLRRGRAFFSSDGSAGPPVVIVNETFAAKFWATADALGKRFRLMQQNSAGPWLTVAGIVPDILQNPREQLKHDALFYIPFVEQPQRQAFFVARTQLPPATLAGAFRSEVQRFDEDLSVYDVRTLEARIAENRLTVSLFGAICSIFAGVATVLAAIGLYAVIANAVGQRTQEIGLRMAIGAAPRDVARLVFAQAIRPLAPGLAVGLALALLATRSLRILLVGVSPNDPLTFVGILVVLTFAAALGCLVPARCAIHVDPVKALRCG